MLAGNGVLHLQERFVWEMRCMFKRCENMVSKQVG